MVLPTHHVDYTLAGGTPERAALKSAITGFLFSQLRGGPCRLYDADLRVRVLHTGLFTYPDVTIICGPAVRDEADRSSVVNPTVLVEVTSPSTQAYDRGDKFEHYKTIPTLREYLVVSHESRRLELWKREPEDAWSLTIAGDGDVVRLAALGASLAVDELYEAAGL
jgi:Uma2 family endonuclease